MRRFSIRAGLRRWLGIDAQMDAIGLLDKTIADEMQFRGQVIERLLNRLDTQRDKMFTLRCEVDRLMARENEIIEAIGKLQREKVGR